MKHVVLVHLRGRDYTHPGFKSSLVYRLVRNPLMLGWFIAFWSAPTMSQGRLLFAILLTAYGFIGILCEERDHLRFLGQDYRKYRARTPMILPFPWRRPTPEPAAAEASGD